MGAHIHFRRTLCAGNQSENNDVISRIWRFLIWWDGDFQYQTIKNQVVRNQYDINRDWLIIHEWAMYNVPYNSGDSTLSKFSSQELPTTPELSSTTIPRKKLNSQFSNAALKNQLRHPRKIRKYRKKEAVTPMKLHYPKKFKYPMKPLTNTSHRNLRYRRKHDYRWTMAISLHPPSN